MGATSSSRLAMSLELGKNLELEIRIINQYISKSSEITHRRGSALVSRRVIRLGF